MSRQLSRRTFLGAGALAAAWTVNGGLIGAQEAPKPKLAFPDLSDLVRHLPPPARYQPRHLPDSINGYLAYRKGVEATVLLGAGGAGQPEEGHERDLDLMLDPTYRPVEVADEVQKAIDEWLDANQASSRLLENAARYRQGEIPPSLLEESYLCLFDPEGRRPFEQMEQLDKVQPWRVQKKLDSGDIAGAVDLLVKIGQVMLTRCESGGTFGHHHITTEGLRQVRGSVASVTQVRGVTEADIRRLMALVDRLRYKPEWLDTLVRTDFQFFQLPILKMMADAKGLEGLIGVIVENPFNRLVPWWDKEEVANTKKMFSRLLEGHSDPFDARATVAESGTIMVRAMDQFRLPRSKQDFELPAEVRRVIELWPPQAAEATGTLTSLYYLGPEGDRPTLNAERLKQLHDDLAQVKNPVGKLMLSAHRYADTASILRDQIVDHELTRLVLAGWLFADKHHRLPDSLEEMVEEEFLNRVPIDPFSERPFLYDRQLGEVWSVGENGRSDTDRTFPPDENGFDPDSDYDDRSALLPGAPVEAFLPGVPRE